MEKLARISLTARNLARVPQSHQDIMGVQTYGKLVEFS